MSRGLGWDLGRKLIAPLGARVTSLEDTYVRTCWFEEIASGTSGTLSLPTGGAVVLNQWEGGVDALTSGVDTNWPTFETPVDSGNAYITTTLDSSGNWNLSGTPSAYPIAIVYIYRVKFVSFDDSYAMFEVEPESELVKDLTPELGGDLGCGGYNIDNVGKICFDTYSTNFCNNTGATLTKGTAITICGLSGDVCCVCKTDNREIAKMPTCGIVFADVANGNEGCGVRVGRINMDTSGMTGGVGDRLYVQGDGSLDTVVPTSGMVQRCGFLVVKASGSAGRICVCLRGPRSMYSAKDQFPIVRMGDTGYEKVSFRQYDNTEIISITPTNLDMNTHKIIGVVDPTANQEAATKKYVDDNVGGTNFATAAVLGTL